MSRLKICGLCGDEFDVLSPAKKEKGGKISHCPDCSIETEMGKAVGLTDVSLEDKETSTKIVRIPRPKKESQEIIIDLGGNQTDENTNPYGQEYIDLKWEDD